MGLCVIHVDSSQFLESDGNVQSAIIMTYVQFVIMETNITLGIDFTELPHLEVKEFFLNPGEKVKR